MTRGEVWTVAGGAADAGRIMVDKLTAVPRQRLGTLVGSLASDEMRTRNRAIFVFLGLSETDTDKK